MQKRKFFISVVSLLLCALFIFGACSVDKTEDGTTNEAGEVIDAGGQGESTTQPVTQPPVRKPSTEKLIALTYDDGPNPSTTNRILTALKKNNSVATFFVVGNRIDSGVDTIRKAIDMGCEIANHTYSHAFNGALYKSVDNFINSVKQQEDVVFHATGIRTDVVRFPAGSYYAKYRKSSIVALDELGYGWIDWSGNSYDSGDNNYTSAQTANTVIWQAKQEKISVMLMHDWNRRTLGALERIVTALRKEKYLFLPLFKDSSTIGNVFPKWD